MTNLVGSKNVLVTGGAGFIGSHLVDTLLNLNCNVTVLDNFAPFYPRSLKENNLKEASLNPNFTLIEGDILDVELLNGLGEFDAIVHLAAQAGVRPSIENPVAYQVTNVQGTQNMLEFAKNRGIKQFVFASSSSVYGISPKVPWSEADSVLMPISPYASTKVSGELLGHVYSHLYDIRFLALRFFTVLAHDNVLIWRSINLRQKCSTVKKSLYLEMVLLVEIILLCMILYKELLEQLTMRNLIMK